MALGSANKDKGADSNMYRHVEQAGLIQVTQQTWVSWVENVTALPENWLIPTGGDHLGAYIMDLSNDPNPYNDAQGQPLAMSTIIKDSVSSLDVYGNLDLCNSVAI